MKKFISALGKAVHCRGTAFTLLAGLILVPSVGSAAPKAAITASRTSGPAPLAVFFDASGTTESNGSEHAFRDLGYRFTFGDPDSGSWRHSGKPKNEQIGAPLAAHVFEQPGTYTVQVTAKNAAGESSTASVLITVQDPNSVYSATKTVCISRTSDFAGCPSGAQQLANATSYPAFQSNTRYLLHRGQDFTSLGNIAFGSSSRWLLDSQIGSFGSGNRPLVGSVTIPSDSNDASKWHRRIVVMDLDIVTLTQSVGGFDLLILRNSLTRGGMILLANSFKWYSERSTLGLPNPEGIFMVENDIDRNYSELNGVNGVTGNALRIAILGNSIDRTVEHEVRLWQAAKAVIAHNYLPGRSASAIRHAIKLHSHGIGSIVAQLPPLTVTNQRTTEVTIADNRIGSADSNINWLVSPGPQNETSAEGLENVIIEDNTFQHGTNFFTDIAWTGRYMVERGNVSLNGALKVSIGHSGALSSDWLGPYLRQSSMKLRFAGEAEKIPQAPAQMTVQ